MLEELSKSRNGKVKLNAASGNRVIDDNSTLVHVSRINEQEYQMIFANQDDIEAAVDKAK